MAMIEEDVLDVGESRDLPKVARDSSLREYRIEKILDSDVRQVGDKCGDISAGCWSGVGFDLMIVVWWYSGNLGNCIA